MAILATNKKATFEYEVLERIEAGIELSGQEVKSVRAGNMKLSGSYVTITPRLQALLKGASIARFEKASPHTPYDPNRQRTLLLHKKQLATLYGKTHRTGLTIIPISVYTSSRRVKVELALCRGKKAADKRSAIKERETKRDIQRRMKYDR